MNILLTFIHIYLTLYNFKLLIFIDKIINNSNRIEKGEEKEKKVKVL